MAGFGGAEVSGPTIEERVVEFRAQVLWGFYSHKQTRIAADNGQRFDVDQYATLDGVPAKITTVGENRDAKKF